MPTAAERRALWFLAGVITLGGGARAVQARRAEVSAARVDSTPVAHQLAAVDSARLRRNQTRRAAPRAAAATSPDRPGPSPARVAAKVPARPLDADAATAIELEALPGVGPSLARRIVAERDANGPFGSLQGLERVRGIGPALVARLTPLVAFSGVPRPGARAPAKAPSHGRRQPSRG